MTILGSAPGKVVLSGEYAVLDGAPAVCVAVNRRAYAKVSSLPGELSEVVAPGYIDVAGRFRRDGSEPEWLAGQSDYRLVDSVLRALNASSAGAVFIELQTGEFSDTESNAKIGIGSSAALTVALTAALSGSEKIAPIAHEAHRAFQNGAGSGADIACSCHGGLLEYRMQDRKVSGLCWPEELQYRLIWSGVPANTREKLLAAASRYDAQTRSGLIAQSKAMAAAWRSECAATIMAEYPSYVAALRDFSTAHKLDIFSAGHDKLAYAAGERRLVYKPCGAGGGDVGIVLGTDAAALDDFVSSQSHPHSLIQCEIDPNGAKIEKR